MHANRYFPASKFLPWAAAAVLALLAGCTSVTLTNLTPTTFPENPSEIYTFTLRVVPQSGVSTDSLDVHVVVDGQNFAMTRSPLGGGLFEFEYQVPPGRQEFAYYYLVDYQVQGEVGSAHYQKYTALARAKVVRRYILSLEVERGPAGARVGILGRGFGSQDTVYLDGTPAQTFYASPTALSFLVPAVPAGRNYQVTLGNGPESAAIGTFHVDPVQVTVNPTSLALVSGERQALTFTVASPAPPSGLTLDVTTDVPESVIMAEVVVPEGQTSVTVQVQGGRPGAGNLFLKGYGADIAIPVTVSAR